MHQSGEIIYTSVLPTGYVAGFVDPEVSNRPDLFDVYVNLPERVIQVSQNAKGTVSVYLVGWLAGCLFLKSTHCIFMLLLHVPS